MNQLHHSGSADNGIVHNHNALALDNVFERVELEAHAHGAQLLRGLDERAGDVAVLDQAGAVGNAALKGVALGPDGRPESGVPITISASTGHSSASLRPIS